MKVVVSSVLILFILVALGYGIGKRKIIRPECASDLSSFLVKIAMPVTVFLSMQMEYKPELAAEGVRIFIAAFIFHFFCLLVGMAAVRLCSVKSEDRGVWLFVSLFSNNGFMGFPLALAIYGNDGLFLMSIANVVTNFLIFSIGVRLLTRGKNISEKLNIRKMFVNNINIAVVLGLICYFSQIRLPQLMLNTLDYVGRITAGLSMIVVGLSLSKMDARQMFRGKNVWLLTAVRLAVIPALTILILKLLPGMKGGMTAGILVLMSGLPSASTVTIISEQYHLDNPLASKAIFMTTLLCIATIPAVMLFV